MGASHAHVIELLIAVIKHDCCSYLSDGEVEVEVAIVASGSFGQP